ncbi:DUF5302 domain-containing protein [Pseudonocardia acaciae]|uniref:DUF5302 domain-containing protein n=1 Tax=Pseudonocardia acaciae TaxID=551276 RepID=UPI00048DFB74|nr:DUF5302 domain-containing protein [Pseudonocardia acaciae]
MAETPEAKEPRDDTDAAQPADTPDAAAPDADTTDDLRSRFREALERKRGEAKARSARGHGAGNPKVGETHRRAGGKRTFRRKSG